MCQSGGTHTTCSNKCKPLSGKQRCEREKMERDKQATGYFCLMLYLTKLDILALLGCSALAINLALAGLTSTDLLMSS